MESLQLERARQQAGTPPRAVSAQAGLRSWMSRPWARREAGQPAEALPAPFQTSRSSCGCCSCTTRTFWSGRAAAGHAAAAHPAGGGDLPCDAWLQPAQAGGRVGAAEEEAGGRRPQAASDNEEEEEERRCTEEARRQAGEAAAAARECTPHVPRRLVRLVYFGSDPANLAAGGSGRGGQDVMAEVDPTTVTTHVRAYWAKKKKVLDEIVLKDTLGAPLQTPQCKECSAPALRGAP
eukprot:scaffold4715_cov45-Phaeocystis_antarctica.AAC.2